jgi:hypothetical protein
MIIPAALCRLIPIAAKIDPAATDTARSLPLTF